MYSAIFIEHDSPVHRNELHRALEGALKTGLSVTETQLSPTDIEVLIGHDHDEWEPGDACPECGSNHIVIPTRRDDSYHTEDGDLQFSDDVHATDDALEVVCTNCMTHLQEIPYKPLDILK